MVRYLLAFAVALALSLILTPLVKIWALRRGFVAQPKSDRWHKQPTALLGGLAIFISFWAAFLAGILFLGVKLIPSVAGLLVGGVLIFALGFYDDIRQIKPHTKLLGQIVVATVAVLLGTSVEIVGASYVAIPLTIFWVVAVINAFNLLDNMDGLSSGIAAIASAIIFASLYLQNVSQVLAPAYVEVIMMASAILAGASLGFLRYIFNPASIFMGDSGSMFLGFVLAWTSLSGTWRDASNLALSFLVALLILAVPIFDTTFVALVRRLQGRPVSVGGKDHLSHRLVALGISERKAVLNLYLVSFLIGSIAVAGYYLNYYVVAIAIVLTLLVLFFLGTFLAKVRVYEEVKAQKPPEGKAVINAYLMYKSQVAEMVVDIILICIAYVGAYLLRYEGVISEGNLELIRFSLPIAIAVKLAAFSFFGLYRTLSPSVGLHELASLAKSVTASSLIIVILLVFLQRFEGYSRVVFIIDWFLTFFAIGGARLSYRLTANYFMRETGRKGHPVLIYGAGRAGELLLREIRNNGLFRYNPVGFIDDDHTKLGKRVHGVRVLGKLADVPSLREKLKVNEMIIAIPTLSEDDMRRVYDRFTGDGFVVKRMTRISVEDI